MSHKVSDSLGAPAAPVIDRSLRKAPVTGMNWVSLGSAGYLPPAGDRSSISPPLHPQPLQQSPGGEGRAGSNRAPRSTWGGRCSPGGQRASPQGAPPCVPPSLGTLPGRRAPARAVDQVPLPAAITDNVLPWGFCQSQERARCWVTNNTAAPEPARLHQPRRGRGDQGLDLAPFSPYLPTGTLLWGRAGTH